MVESAFQVVVIGAGVMGAAVAWRLAEAGAETTVLERHGEPALGVTRWSYGWVGTSSIPPSSRSDFGVLQRAMAAFSDMEAKIGPLPIATRGAIVWLETERDTEALIREQQAAGIAIEPVSRRQLTVMEPHLLAPPEFAAWAAGDFAVEPVELTRHLLRAAQDAGARILYDHEAHALDIRGGRVNAVVTGHGRIAANAVVLANAAAAVPLVGQLGLALSVHEEPAVLMRFSAGAKGLLNHLLYGEGLELRPDLHGGLVSADDYPEHGAEGLADLAARTARTISELFGPALEPRLRAIQAAWRPMTMDGLPISRFLDGVGGVYALIAHPGVILAPLLGQEAARDILDRK